jgi:hypothetical protein
VISLRFTGGPLDGHTDHTETPAYEYRLIRGVYRRGRTHRRRGEPIVTYRWQADDAPRRDAPAAEPVSMW